MTSMMHPTLRSPSILGAVSVSTCPPGFFSLSSLRAMQRHPTYINGERFGADIESTAGTFWLYGTAVEHHVFYQYQLSGTTNIFMGQIQTETPYYQPTPNAESPFPVVSSLNDPNFASSCSGVSGNCAAAWAFRVINSSNILVYGAGTYSFFSEYSTTCSTFSAGQTCQARINSLEGTISNVNIYNLNTIGAQSMLNNNGAQVAYYNDNVNVFPSCVAVYKSG